MIDTKTGSTFIYYFHDCYDRRSPPLHYQGVSSFSKRGRQPLSIDGVGINLFQLAFEVSSSTKRKSGWQNLSLARKLHSTCTAFTLFATTTKDEDREGANEYIATWRSKEGKGKVAIALLYNCLVPLPHCRRNSRLTTTSLCIPS